MIRSFPRKGLRRFYQRNEHKGVPPEMGDKIARVLARLDLATRPAHMDIPGFRPHSLKGEYRGYWSVWINANWRIVFRFEQSVPADVDLVDYH